MAPVGPAKLASARVSPGLVCDYLDTVNAHGINSDEVRAMRAKHRDVPEFIDYANAVDRLKRTFAKREIDRLEPTPVDRLTPGWWWVGNAEGRRWIVELRAADWGDGKPVLHFTDSLRTGWDGQPTLLGLVGNRDDLTWLGRVNMEILPPEGYP